MIFGGGSNTTLFATQYKVYMVCTGLHPVAPPWSIDPLTTYTQCELGELDHPAASPESGEAGKSQEGLGMAEVPRAKSSLDCFVDVDAFQLTKTVLPVRTVAVLERSMQDLPWGYGTSCSRRPYSFVN